MADSPDYVAKTDPRDTSVLAGLFGSQSDLDALIERLIRQETELLTKEQTAFESDRDSYASRIEAEQEAVSRFDEDMAAAETKLGREREELEGIRKRLSDLVASRLARIAALFARRSTYAARFIAEKAKAYDQVRTLLSSHWLDSERQLFDWQRQLHGIEVERRELNAEEFVRRAALLTVQQEACRDRLRTLESLIERLRLTGITRTVSGFLLWAGYLSFAALGWMLGEELVRAHQASGGAGQSVFTVMGRGVAGMVTSSGVPATVAALFLGPLVLLGAVFGLLWAWDKGLRKFDGRWPNTKKNTRQGYAPTLWLNADLPITRSSYTDLLAKLPLIYLGSLVPLVLATVPALVGTPTNASGTAGSSPWDAALFTYAGTVIVLTATGLALLYVTNVVRPRFNALPEARLGLRSSLLLNIELVIIAALALLVFVAMPTTSIWTSAIRQPWELPSSYGLSMLVVVVSFATAHGLMFHGLFKDYQKLQTELRQYDLNLQDSTSLPSIEMATEQTEQFKIRLAALYSDLDSLWSTPDWWTVLTGRRAIVREPFRFRKRRRVELLADPAQLTPWDVLLEPVLASELQQVEADFVNLSQQAEVAAGNIRVTEERLSKIREEQDKAKRSLGTLADGLNELTRRHHAELDRLGREYPDLIFQLRTAFRLGESLSR